MYYNYTIYIYICIYIFLFIHIIYIYWYVLPFKCGFITFSTNILLRVSPSFFYLLLIHRQVTRSRIRLLIITKFVSKLFSSVLNKTVTCFQQYNLFLFRFLFIQICCFVIRTLWIFLSKMKTQSRSKNWLEHSTKRKMWNQFNLAKF